MDLAILGYPSAVRIVRRPKLNSIVGQHYGVEFVFCNTRRIFDLTPEGGMRSVDRAEFSGGEETIASPEIADPAELRAAWNRLCAFSRRSDRDRYEFLARNCEHFATYVMTGVPVSKQIQAMAGVGIGAAVLWALRDR